MPTGSNDSKDLLKDFFADLVNDLETMSEQKPTTKASYAMKTSERSSPSPSSPSPLPLKNTYTPLLPSPQRLIPMQTLQRPKSPAQPQLTSPSYKIALSTPPTITSSKLVDIPSSSSSKLYTSSSSPRPSTSKFLMMEKPIKTLISTIEPEIIMKPTNDPWEIATNFLPRGFTFMTSHLKKTRQYFEFILVDSDSIEVTHNYSPNNPSEISYSKCRILKILTLTDWGQRQWTPKTLSQTYEPQYYNYTDYIDAWNNFLFIGKTHSWFIYFCPNCPRTFPNWFVQLWDSIGFHEDILPNIVKSGYQEFDRLYTKQSFIPTSLAYAFDLHVSWIFAWDFKVIEELTASRAILPYLYRTYKVKWWSKFELSRLHISQVQRLFSQNVIINPPQGLQDFQSKKKRLMEQLISCNSENDMQRIMEQIAACSEKTDEIDPFADVDDL